MERGFKFKRMVRARFKLLVLVDSVCGLSGDNKDIAGYFFS